MKLGKILNGKEVKSFIVKASELAKLGWDFSGENDAEFFGMTEEEFLREGEVNVCVDDTGKTTYLSSPKPCDWQQADAHVPTGDDEQTVEDLIVLQEWGVLKEL